MLGLTDTEEHDFTRAQMAATLGLALLSVVILLGVYYTVPIAPHPHTSVWLRLVIALFVFAVALGHEVTAILRHLRPMQRAIVALAVILPLFVVLFAWIYLTMSRSNPAMFGVRLTRTSALYYTVTVLSTVGFGDITPKTDVARLATTIQMVADLILVAVVVRLIMGAASRASRTRT